MRYSTTTQYARLEPVPGGLAFVSSYSPDLVTAFKQRIPAECRKWDNPNKRWIVEPRYGSVCAELADRFLNVFVTIPSQTAFPSETTTKLIRLEYLGQCKQRDDGSLTAFGYSEGGWNVIFPETVLQEWFSAVPTRPGEKPTLYAVLGVKQISPLDEIRSAYRRLARQWHPDVCHEPDASDQFKAIQHAWDILSDPLKRKKLDAGMKLEASLTKQSSNDLYRPNGLSKNNGNGGFRSPLRCGWVYVSGVETLGRFLVSSVLQWEDITNSAGRVMVVSWQVGNQTFEVTWV